MLHIVALHMNCMLQCITGDHSCHIAADHSCHIAAKAQFD